MQIVSVVFIIFLKAFDVTSILLDRFFFCMSAPLGSKRLEILILFVSFWILFDFNLAESLGLLNGEGVSLIVTTFSVIVFS